MSKIERLCAECGKELTDAESIDISRPGATYLVKSPLPVFRPRKQTSSPEKQQKQDHKSDKLV